MSKILKSLASRPNGQAKSLVRFAGFKVKEQQGPEYFCGFSKRPVLGADGCPCYVAAEFVKDRDSRGRPRRTPVRTETFPKRLAAADQSLDWFLSHVKLEGANGPFSRTQRKLLARRLKHLGLRVSLTMPNPLPESMLTPINPHLARTELGARSVPVPSPVQSPVEEVADRSDVSAAIGSGHAAEPENAKTHDDRVHGPLMHIRRALTSFVVTLCGFRRERASCANQ